MLAKPAATLPAGSALPGGTVYEPKMGRLPRTARAHEQRLLGLVAQGADLAAGFPEIVQAACERLEPGTVIDGELVVWRDGRLDFGALAPRLAYRGRRLPADLPAASFLAFDVLAIRDVDVRREPLRARRAQLLGMTLPCEVGGAQ
jgi:hypothetical protein